MADSPKKVLLLAAFAGGSVGALAGMMMFRHKTKKAKFVISVPIFFCDPLCDSRICAFELLKNNVTVQPAPFVKPHCVLIVAAATVLLIKRRSAHTDVRSQKHASMFCASRTLYG